MLLLKVCVPLVDAVMVLLQLMKPISVSFAWTDFRLSANYQPVKWIGVAVNYGVGTFGDSFGWIVNIAPKGWR